MIRFNGMGENGHETFLFKLDSEKFNFCKTARKPYDLPVCKILLVLKHYMPNLELSSDGFSEGGYEECNWPEAVKWYENEFNADVEVFNGRLHVLVKKPKEVEPLKFTVIYRDTMQSGSHTLVSVCMKRIFQRTNETLMQAVKREGILDNLEYIFVGHPLLDGESPEG